MKKEDKWGREGLHLWRPDRDVTFCGKTRQEYSCLGDYELRCLACEVTKELEEASRRTRQIKMGPLTRPS